MAPPTKTIVSNPSSLTSHPLTSLTPVEVVLGNPAKDCLHFGICRIHLYTGQKSPCGCRIPAYARAIEGVGIELIFEKKKLPEKTALLHFGNGYFYVETTYKLPADVASAIGIKDFDIPAGKYPVREEGGWLRVVFG